MLSLTLTLSFCKHLTSRADAIVPSCSVRTDLRRTAGETAFQTLIDVYNITRVAMNIMLSSE